MSSGDGNQDAIRASEMSVEGQYWSVPSGVKGGAIIANRRNANDNYGGLVRLSLIVKGLFL